ncbi:unnamed protein product, partial [Callosobruchus maculatus]
MPLAKAVVASGIFLVSTLDETVDTFCDSATVASGTSLNGFVVFCKDLVLLLLSTGGTVVSLCNVSVVPVNLLCKGTTVVSGAAFNGCVPFCNAPTFSTSVVLLLLSIGGTVVSLCDVSVFSVKPLCKGTTVVSGAAFNGCVPFCNAPTFSTSVVLLLLSIG